jgi:hypothetical protein
MNEQLPRMDENALDTDEVPPIAILLIIAKTYVRISETTRYNVAIWRRKYVKE